MELYELKNNLLENKTPNLPILFINSDSDYLVNSYINKIAQINKQTIQKISSLEEINNVKNNLFNTNCLFVLEFNKEVKDIDLSDLNIIIVSKENIDLNIDKVEFTPLEKWQIEDYVSILLPGINKENISWLCNKYQYDIFKLNIEANKIKLFNRVDQNDIFNKLYPDRSQLNINVFSLVNALVKKDFKTVKTIIRENNNINIFSLISNLINQFSLIINVKLSNQPNPYKLNLSEAQFKAIKFNSDKYTDEKLINIYKKLNNIDFDLKSGYLDLNSEYLLQYLINQIV